MDQNQAFDTDRQRDLDSLSVADAKRYLAEGQFPPGSMGPKILGAIRFIENGGRDVLITSPRCLRDALDGRAGTRIIP